MRDSLAEALADGSRGVTAKVRWLASAASKLDSDSADDGRPRWIHCTPLLGQSGAVGVWMVVLVDDEKSGGTGRRFRQAPPVPNDLRRNNASPRSSTPAPAAWDSDNEMDYRALRNRSMPNGNGPRHLVLDAMRQPPGYMSEQRASRSGSPIPSAAASVMGGDPSIKSFAL